MNFKFDTVIVGGGVVGTACALAFARQKMRVALVERDDIGGGATAAAMGHVVVLDDSPAQLALTRYSQKLWRQAGSELPVDVDYNTRGTLWVAEDDEELQQLYRKLDVYTEQSIPCEVMNAETVARVEPALRAELAGGMLVKEDVIVSPQFAAKSFMRQAITAGATLIQQSAVAMGKGTVLLSDGAALEAPVLINAGGEWASALTPGLPVAMRKGHLAMTRPYPGFLHHQVVELGYLKSAHVTTTDTVAFNVQPRTNGQLLIGSSRQFGVTNREVEPAMMDRMFAHAAEFLPALPSLAIERTWAGFRSATPDKLPLIGPIDRDSTVLLATGHEGLGITTSLATAQLLADLIAGKTPAIPIEPYLPGRSALQPAIR